MLNFCKFLNSCEFSSTLPDFNLDIFLKTLPLRFHFEHQKLYIPWWISRSWALLSQRKPPRSSNKTEENCWAVANPTLTHYKLSFSKKKFRLRRRLKQKFVIEISFEKYAIFNSENFKTMKNSKGMFTTILTRASHQSIDGSLNSSCCV